MAEAVLTLAEGILTKVISLAAQEISLAWGFKAELERLRKTLSTVEGYLGDVVHQPQGRGKSIEDWVTNLKGVAQDADDVLDEINYELLRRKVELQNHMKKKVLNFFSLSNPVAFSFKMAHKIQKINASLADLKSESSVIGLVSRKVDAASQGIRGSIQTDSLPEKDGMIVGREKALSSIVTTLTNSNNNQENLYVTAIVGMAGLGKTTLAKSVYNEQSIDRYFDKKIWVCVSDPFNINVILICMLESLNPTKATVRENQDALLKYLQEELKEKRYLLVLDDVWNEDPRKWNNLMSYLAKLNSVRGSKIIVTTRSAKVASISEKLLPRHNLANLSTDECWSILKDRAFVDSRVPMDPDLEKIGKEIAENCAGVPLMAKVLGGILFSKKSIAEWSSIKDSRIWDLPEEDDRIIPVLKLSYDHLTSPSLKQCFTYCSVLRKDVEIERDNLIQLWMAQGLLHPSPDKSKEMEDIGNEYFDILLQSSLFQDARTDEYGIISKCKMHDLVHDLAELVSKSETSTQDKYGHTLEVRHVALVSTSILESIRESSVGRLHSLFSDGKLPSNMLPGFKALRVLNLFKANIEELPISIGKLKHLRYLDISETRFKILPNSIGKLYNLQTLRATNCALEEFPKEVENLINLRHIYWDERTKFPLGILGKLSCLRTLPPFYVDTEMGREIEELAGLNQLKGQLIIYNMEHVRDRDEAGKAKLEEKKNLRHLIFVWTKDRLTTNNNEEDALEGLQPHPKLESLMIKYFMGAKFPSWMTSRSLWLDNLKKIVLCGCNKCEEVPTLGHLPHLTVVWIDGMNNLKCVGADFYGYNNVYHVATSGTRKRALFPVLKELCIRNCNELIEWMEAPKEVMAFPCLEELEINNCPKLRKAPSHFPFLKKLKIKGNDELTCLPEGILLKNGNNLISIEIRDCNKLTCIALDVFSCCASLGKLDVRNCRQLRHLPDGLDTLPLLERLTIKECPSLELIPIRHSGIASLRELKIEHCEGLSGLLSVLEYCTSLQVMSIENCKNLTSIRLRTLASLCKLRIGCCPGLSGQLSGLEYCASLQELWIWDCSNLTSIGITYDMSLTCLQELTIVSCDELSSLPALQQCPSLRKLHITNCPKVTSISSISLHDNDHDFKCAAVAAALSISHENLLQSTILSSLEHLSICDCPSLQSVPDLHSFTSLRALVVIGCGRLQRLVSGLSTKMPISLVELSIHYCSDLQSIPDLQNFTSLRRLSIRDCKRLERLVCSGLQMPVSLVELCVVNCISLQSIPDLHIFPSLRRLTIENCETLERLVSSASGLQMPVSLVELKIREAPNLETLPSLDNLTSLSTLEIYNCGKLKDLPTALHCSTSLKKLELGGFWDGLDSFPGFHVGTGSSQLETLILTGWPKLKSLPEQIQYFTSLTYLWIECFDGMEAFPEWLGNLTSLTRLEIWNFKNLMYLPSVNTMQRLTKLQTLQISGCPLLQQRCTKDSGPEWTKISHIPDIKVRYS